MEVVSRQLLIPGIEEGLNSLIERTVVVLDMLMSAQISKCCVLPAFVVKKILSSGIVMCCGFLPGARQSFFNIDCLENDAMLTKPV